MAVKKNKKQKNKLNYIKELRRLVLIIERVDNNLKLIIENNLDALKVLKS